MSITKALGSWWRRSYPYPTTQDLYEMEKRIMSKISDYAAAQKAANEQIGAAVDGLTTSTTGLVADVQSLKDKIDALQNSPGEVSQEDQVLLDTLQVDAGTLVARIAAAAAAVKALDDATGNLPTPPVA